MPEPAERLWVRVNERGQPCEATPFPRPQPKAPYRQVEYVRADILKGAANGMAAYYDENTRLREALIETRSAVNEVPASLIAPETVDIPEVIQALAWAESAQRIASDALNPTSRAIQNSSETTTSPQNETAPSGCTRSRP